MYRRPQINSNFNCVKMRPLTSKLYDVEIIGFKFSVKLRTTSDTKKTVQIFIIHRKWMTD